MQILLSVSSPARAEEFSDAIRAFLQHRGELEKRPGSRKRWIATGCAMVVVGLSAPLIAVVSGHMFCARFQPRIGIRAEGDRIFAESTALGLWPIVWSRKTDLSSDADVYHAPATNLRHIVR